MKTRRKRKLKLDPDQQRKLAKAIGKVDPKLQQKLVKRIRKLDPKLAEELSKRILPARPPKPKVTPKFRSRFLAFEASQNLKAFSGMIHNAALAEDKLFFKYLGEFLKKRPTWSPISEEQRKLLQLYYSQKPHLSSSEALKELQELRWLNSKGHYRGAKKKALERWELMNQVFLNGWIDSLQ